jgi:proteasome inhibitor subunit 1 (PI31)
MYVGPGHPIFGRGQQPGGGPQGPWGGDGFLPPMGAPQGARFDPVGPFGPIGGRGGGAGFRLPGRGGGGRPFGSPFSGEPDNDEFMPPQFGGGGNAHGDMYM